MTHPNNIELKKAVKLVQAEAAVSYLMFERYDIGERIRKLNGDGTHNKEMASLEMLYDSVRRSLKYYKKRMEVLS